LEQGRATDVLPHHHITNNWRGRPLLSRQVVVNLIGSVTTDQGLRVKAALDESTCEAGTKVSDADLAIIDLKRDELHRERTNPELQVQNIEQGLRGCHATPNPPDKSLMQRAGRSGIP